MTETKGTDAYSGEWSLYEAPDGDLWLRRVWHDEQGRRCTTFVAELNKGGRFASEHAALLAAAPAMREALEPFAELANEVDDAEADDVPLHEHFASMDLTVGDLRRARAALALTKEDG